jgi:hypothetical protein
MSDSTRRAGLLAALALIGALCAGGVLGYALGSRPRPMRPKQMALLGVSRAALLDSLRLDPGQRARVDSILDGSEARAERSIQRMMAEVRDLTREARDGIADGMDPATRARFDSLLASAFPVQPRSPLPPRDTSR